MKLTHKSVAVAGYKQSPTSPTAEQLEKINKFTRRTFTADEIYVGQMRLANNAVDRDVERFSEDLLKSFADTLPRKTLLLDHDYNAQRSALGKFFEVEIESLSRADAEALTGEKFRLPEGSDEVQFLAPWFYIPVKGVSEETLTKIDAGIFDFVSIGFTASSREAVKDAEGRTLYHEYKGPGEAYEGSLVYLGAQYGAAVKTPIDTKPEKQEDKMPYGKIAAKIGREVTAENVVEVVSEVLDGKDAKITELSGQVEDLKPKAAMGEKYHADLIGRYVAGRAKLGEIGDTEDEQKAMKTRAGSFDIDFLRGEVDLIEKRVAEKFPAESQLRGEDGTDKGAKKNPLIPED